MPPTEAYPLPTKNAGKWGNVTRTKIFLGGARVRDSELGDARRAQRVIWIAGARANRASAPLPESLGSASEVKAGYRFFENPAIEPEQIIEAHSREAIKRARAAQGKYVLAIQDTMHVEAEIDRWVHSTMLAPIDRVPYGVVGLQVWERATTGGTKKQARKKKPTAEKESNKWLEGIRSCAKLKTELAAGQELVFVVDRESDVFDAFEEARTQGVRMVIRASQNRRIVEDETQKLWEYVSSQESAGQLNVAIQRNGERDERVAKCTVRYASATIQPPLIRARENLEPIKTTVIHVIEEGTPVDVSNPVEWLLLATVDVADISDALECVKIYTARWLIEMYHRILKSGCKVEERQFETLPNFRRYMAVDVIVAWRLLYLTMRARAEPQAPCTEILAEADWRVLFALANENKPLPKTSPTLADVVVWIAKMGGYLARKSDGPPGVNVIWRGMTNLQQSIWAIRKVQNCG